MQDLGERKELLGPEEHDALVSLVDFSEQRTIEKLEAQAALGRLATFFPETVRDT